MSEDLTRRCGRGFGYRNPYQMRQLPGLPANPADSVRKIQYARHHWTRTDENPPVGLILRAEHRAGVARYAQKGISSTILAAEYRTALPSEETLATELERRRKLLEGKRDAASKTRKD